MLHRMPALQTALPGLDADCNGREVRHRAKRTVTFKGGQAQPAHRWFRLTPSFAPDLVRSYVERFGLDESSIVLDPFAGRGTTPIECKRLGISCVGIELNPLLHFAGSVSLDWGLNHSDLQNSADRIQSDAQGLRKQFANLSSEQFASKIGVEYPKIHNIHRWWREDVLRDLLAIKYGVKKHAPNARQRDFLLLALANILVDAASVTIGRLQLHFIDRTKVNIDAIELFSESCNRAIFDLAQLASMNETDCRIINGNSMRINEILMGHEFDAVITSPPYPNRYSYVWNTRPHLYFLDIFDTPRQAATLDCETIGGTWGTATSRHQKGEYSFTSEQAQDATASIVEEIRPKDNLMANYVAKYFDDLGVHIGSLKRHLRKDGKCAYVVGNSRIKGSIVETDEILARIFENHGFMVEEREEIRRRNSGKELHETTVVAIKR